jgi:flagellar export protein FliJ
MSKRDSNTPKAVWDSLLVKAQAEVKQAQLSLTHAHQQKQQAVHRCEKIERLLLEYSQRLNELQQRSHNSAEARNYRQFIVQLQAIAGQARSAIEGLEVDCIDARSNLQAADLERLKVESLAQRAREKLQRETSYLEAKATESDNLIMYNSSRP